MSLFNHDMRGSTVVKRIYSRGLGVVRSAGDGVTTTGGELAHVPGDNRGSARVTRA